MPVFNNNNTNLHLTHVLQEPGYLLLLFLLQYIRHPC